MIHSKRTSVIGIFMIFQLVSSEANAARFCNLPKFLKNFASNLSFVEPAPKPPAAFFEAYTGKRIENAEQLFPRSLPEHSKIYFIESGGMGGSVYRVELAGGKSEIWKVYKNDYEAGKDFNLLTTLSKISQKENYRGFRIAQPIERDRNLLRLEYISGKSLYSLRNGQRNFKIGNRMGEVISEYKRKVSYTFEALQKEFPEYHFALREGFYEAATLSSPDKSVIQNYFFHQGNVLVDPYTLELTLIDPY